VQQVVSGGGELLGRSVERGPVRDLEFDADLRRRQVLGPLVLAETGMGGLGQRPDTEVPRPLDGVLDRPPEFPKMRLSDRTRRT
jgi:hypothetical protein